MKTIKIDVTNLLREQYTLDFGQAGVEPPLVPTVNVPTVLAPAVLQALLDEHPAAPFVTSWSRLANGNVQVLLQSRENGMDVAEFAIEKFGGSGSIHLAEFEIHASTF